jgi:phospholipase C
MRVPLLCISPYAMQGVVNHTQLEAASVVRFIEDNFSLGRLTAPDGTSVRDAAATSAATGCLNLKQQPRAFVPITSSYSKSFFLHERSGPPTQAEGDGDGD